MKRKGFAILAAALTAFMLPMLPPEAVPATVQAEAAENDICTVRVNTGYLALRSARTYDDKNEIGELYTGDMVQVLNRNDSTYWYVYSPKYSLAGYVNKNYLVNGSQAALTAEPAGDTYKVKVNTGYLALRSSNSYDVSNEIGELYTGDTVTLLNKDDPNYWYVYSPKFNKSGYVNKNYLNEAVITRTVRVSSGYLALRTSKSYDYRNEIGQLYTGDTVTVQNTSDSIYWYVYSPKLNKSGYVNKNYLY